MRCGFGFVHLFFCFLWLLVNCMVIPCEFCGLRVLGFCFVGYLGLIDWCFCVDC